MKGIVFNLLEEVVHAAYGEDAWNDLPWRAGLGGVCLPSTDDGSGLAFGCLLTVTLTARAA